MSLQYADLSGHQNAGRYLSNLKVFCKKVVPFIDFYRKQIDYSNKTSHRFLTKEIFLVLPRFPNDRKERRSIIPSLVTSFKSLAYESISSYLHNRRQKTLQKAFVAMGNKVNLEQNIIFHFEDSMEIYGIYNSDTLEKLINTVYNMHNRTTWNEKLLASKFNHWYHWYLFNDGIGHYAINSLLFLTTARERYVKMYERFII